MPTLLDDKNDTLNPGEQDYRRKVGDDSAYISAGLDQLETHANDQANHDESVQEAEEAGDGRDGLYNPGDGGSFVAVPASRWQVFTGVFRKKSASYGLVIALLLGGGAAFLGPGTMLVNLAENIGGHNDSASPSMHNRLKKVLDNLVGEKGGVCQVKTATCRMGRVSNSALNRLARAGVHAEGYDGKRLGYPSSNPTHFTIDGVDGKHEFKNLNKVLAENPKVARKVLGVQGAFNLRFNTWAGKMMSKMFKTKFDITRNGGLADGKNGGAKGAQAATEKLTSSIRKPNTSSGVNKLSAQTRAKVGKAGKIGGAVYLGALGACIAIKLPKVVSSMVAGYQLMTMAPLISDSVLSPAAKLQAGEISPEDLGLVGTLLTEKTKNSNGEMTSALDSKYFLAAMGVNTAPTGPSEKFTPGYGFLTSDFVQNMGKVDSATESSCNVIMNPITMFAVGAAWQAAKVIAGGGTLGIGWVVGQATDLIAAYGMAEALGKAIEHFGPGALEWLAKNNNLETLRGEELGDALGMSAMAYYGTGNMSAGLGTLSQSQVSEFVAIKAEQEDEQRQMDIAALSPFDASSKYTFLGSIVNRATTSMLRFGTYNLTASSLLSNILRMPSLIAIPSVNAATSAMGTYCSYAGVFGLDTGDPSTTPAINAAGLPCTGITAVQSNMSTEEAIGIIEREGWIKTDIETDEGATIDDLVSSGFIVADTPMSSFIEDCTDSSSGNYIFNSAGCIVSEGSTNQPPVDPNASSCVESVDGEGEVIQSCAVAGEGGVSTYKPLESPKALEAITVFLLDYQIAQSINGGNDFEGNSPTVAPSPIDLATLYQDSINVPCDSRTTDAGAADGYRKGVLVKIKTCAIEQLGGVKVNSRISSAAVDMVEALKAKGITVSATSGFRTNESQKALYDAWARGYGNPAAKPGYSNHQMGLAIDMKFYDSSGKPISNTTDGCVMSSGVCTLGSKSPGYTWMTQNAKTYGFTQLETEFWHWEVGTST